MQWIVEVEVEDDEALDRVLLLGISDPPKLRTIEVHGLSDDELKSRILALTNVNQNQND